MEFEFYSIDSLNAYYFSLFKQTQGLLQTCDKHYFAYVQKLLVKRYKRDVKRFAKDEKKEYRLFRKTCKKGKFNAILQELTLKCASKAKIGNNQNLSALNRPTADSQSPKANTGNQETGERLQGLVQGTDSSSELPDNECRQPQEQKKQEEKESQDDFLPL